MGVPGVSVNNADVDFEVNRTMGCSLEGWMGVGGPELGGGIPE